MTSPTGAIDEPPPEQHPLTGPVPSARQTPHAPARYELRVQGHLDERWATWFGGLTLICKDDGTTTLCGAVIDQAELHGLLAKVRDLGATLISVKTTDCPDQAGAIPGLGLEPPAKVRHNVRVSSPLDAITWPVRTDRLTLRPATPDDLEATWQARQDARRRARELGDR
jgi:hypothetical protein